MSKNATAIWLIPLMLASGIAHAQTTPPVVQKSEPSRTASPAYTSVFQGYQSYRDEKSLDWKEANRQVERRGGWREYAKEAQEPETKPGQVILSPSQAADRVAPKPKSKE